MADFSCGHEIHLINHSKIFFTYFQEMTQYKLDCKNAQAQGISVQQLQANQAGHGGGGGMEGDDDDEDDMD